MLYRKSKHTFGIRYRFSENRAVYEITCTNIVELGWPIWRMRISCWITKATDTHSEYVVLIAFHCNSGCTNAP